MIVERVGYRPLRDAPRASAAITGLMIGIILETGNLALLGAQRISFPSLIQTTTYDLGGVFITNKKIMIVLVSVLLSLALHQFVRRTKWGMAMRATAFDYVVVPLMGVPINTIAAMTFAIGSALAAAAATIPAARSVIAMSRRARPGRREARRSVLSIAVARLMSRLPQLFIQKMR